MERRELTRDELFKSYQLTWKEAFFKFYAPLSKPWFWAIMTPLAVITSTFFGRYTAQTEEIHRRYNEIHGRTNVQFNPYKVEHKEIYKMLDYLDEKGVKVGDETVRLSRSIDNFFDKLPF